MKHRIGFIGCGLVVSLVACTSQLDMSAIKTSIKDGLKKQTGADASSVTCPEKREAKANDTFECTADLGGGTKATIVVTQKDASGSYEWKLKQALVPMAKLEPLVVSGLKEQAHVDAMVDCGSPRYRISTPASTFECKAKAGTDEGKVQITVKDAEGNFSWKLVEPSPAPEHAE